YRQLRNSQVGAPMQTGGSLPYRQLRNYTGPDKRIKKEFTAVQQLRNLILASMWAITCSLPYRQLRNLHTGHLIISICSLPYRQLRKVVKTGKRAIYI
ncbi:hypothetical protein, partial [Legionella pneumophila]